MAKNKMKMVGIMKYGYIWQMLIMAIMIEVGPSRVSIKESESALSKMPKSFENLLMRTPEGVISKKWPGLRTIPFTMLSWMF